MRDVALLFKRVPFGETSLIVQGLTRESGRVHLLAKGAYRLNSRYCGALDLFDLLELEWTQRPTAGLGELREARVLRRARSPRRGLASFRAALSVLEWLELGAREGAAQASLFELASGALLQLEAPEPPPEWVQLAFALRFLADMGLRPALLDCASCGQAAPPVSAAGTRAARAAFSASAGGRLCATCAARARAEGRRVGTLPVTVLDDARSLLDEPAGHWRLGPAHGPAWRELCEFGARFSEYHLEHRARLGPRSLLGSASDA